MDDESFQGHIDGIRNKIDQLPENVREKLAPMMEQMVEAHIRRRQLVGEAMDALGELRVQLKYLVFDLEATRRENEDLRRRLGEG